MSNKPTLPLLVMIAPNGQRDTLDRTTVIEVVLAKDRAIQISIAPISDVNDVGVMITEVRDGCLEVRPLDGKSIMLTSESLY